MARPRFRKSLPLIAIVLVGTGNVLVSTPHAALIGEGATARTVQVVTPDAPGALPPATADPEAIARTDRIFSRWDSTHSAGCTLGIRLRGATVLARAYGMADLEHDIANSVDTIIEAGSVSKQFTALAVLLLARDGKLSLDDPVRKYIPELPDYGAPLLIRHMLSHTSGLRDWGSVEAIAGWPRTTRVYTQAHVLDLASRQRALNFLPGSQYSYSNTGYNLAALLVSRVSGQSFAEFTRKQIFEPLGMSHTSWRDDHERIVRGSAVAYQRTRDGGWREQMPFENVHGNGGLLTTVADLLAWNENFESPRVGGPDVVARMQQPALLNDGTPIDYGLGLMLSSWRGVPEVGHSGSTAGYRAYLTRFPRQGLSVAVLCNASDAETAALAHTVAEGYLGTALQPVTRPVGVRLDKRVLEDRAGLYRSQRTGAALRLVVDQGRLRLVDGPEFVPTSGTAYVLGPAEARAEFETDDHGAVTAMRIMPGNRGDQDRFEKQTAASPTADALAQYAGRYRSDEAEVELDAGIDAGRLVLRRRPDSVIVLTPAWKDAFTGDIGTVVFTRNAAGDVTGLRLSASRLYDLRFDAVASEGARRPERDRFVTTIGGTDNFAAEGSGPRGRPGISADVPRPLK